MSDSNPEIISRNDSSTSNAPGHATHNEASSDDPTNQTGDVHWQRMSPKFIIVGTLRNLRSLIFPAILILVTGGGPRGDGPQQFVYLGIAFLFGLFAGVSSLVGWWNFRYAFTDRDFVARSGVVQKQERVVPYGRIQAINVEEAPLERLVGIVRLKVETAAGGTADVKIDALERDRAHELREELSAARARARQDQAGPSTTTEEGQPEPASFETGDAAVADGELLRKLSTAELLALGATSGRIGPAAAVAGALLQFGTELFPDSWWDRVPWQRAEALTNIGVAVTLLFGAAVIAWLLAIGSTALAFGGFELRRSGDQLLVQHGLLDRRRTTIPIQRIQAVVVGEQLLRQPFHYADVRFESAGGGAGEGGSQGDSGVLFPYLPLREVEGLLNRAAPTFAVDPATPVTMRLPGRALRRYIMNATLDWVLFVAVAMVVQRFWTHQWIDQVSWQQIGLLYVATPIFIWLGWARWRDAGWTLDSRLLLLRWRSISRQTMITRTERIQRRSLTTDPFQRRVHLATVRLSVASGMAGGHFALPHADQDDAERIIAQLGGPRHDIEIRKVPVGASS